MNNFFAAFQKELFRPIVTLLFPGLLSLSPYAILICRGNPWLQGKIFELGFTSAMLISCVALFIGMILEEFGAIIESKWDDLRGERHLHEWQEYLNLALECEPISLRYIRGLVLRLKFQLGAYGAFLVSSPGVGLLSLSYVNPLVAYLILLGWLLLACFLRCEAATLFRLLATTRRNLLTSKLNDYSTLHAPCNTYPVLRGQLVICSICALLIFVGFSLIHYRGTLSGLLAGLFHIWPLRSLTHEYNWAGVALIVISLTIIGRSIVFKNTRNPFVRELLEFWIDRISRRSSTSIRVHLTCHVLSADEVRLVGEGPELGNWQWKEGIVLEHGDLDPEGWLWFASFRLDKARKCKLMRKSGGKPQFEDGDDRVLDVEKYRRSRFAEYEMRFREEWIELRETLAS